MPFVRRKRGQVLVVHNVREDGKVKQQTLHQFLAPAELEAVLTEEFETWKRAMAWRYPDYRFNWSRLKGRLEEALAEWEAEPTGANQRRDNKVRREAAGLLVGLEGLSAARVADKEVVSELLPTLVALRASIDRITGARTSNPAVLMQPSENRDAFSEADAVFDSGMEYWWSGERREAKRLFKKALKIDPLHADAHNHLAIDAMDRGQLTQAEKHLSKAQQGGARVFDCDTDAKWDIIEHRPFLRALLNLALVRRRQGRYEDALRVHRAVLSNDPGLAYSVERLMAEEHHQLGEFDQAALLYERHLSDPHCGHSLSLLRFQQSRTGAAGIALVRAFAGNRYIAPMLLGLPWKRLPGRRVTSMEEPEWASDYVEEQGELWRSVRGSADFLGRWWNAPPVQEWLAELAEVSIALGNDNQTERGRFLSEREQLISEDRIRVVAETVEPGAANVPALPPRLAPAASLDEVRIERDGEAAIIHFADERFGPVRLNLGADNTGMTDLDVLEVHNEMSELRREAMDAYEYKAKEIPPGRPQVQLSRYGGYEMRGDVLRALIEGHEDGQTRLIIDGRTFTMPEVGHLLSCYEGWGVRLTVVPEDELHEVAEVHRVEPDDGA